MKADGSWAEGDNEIVEKAMCFFRDQTLIFIVIVHPTSNRAR